MDRDDERITLTDEEGNETEFYVIGDLELDGKTYVAFEPCENEEGEYVILRVETDEDGEETLVTIDDDDEFEKAAEAFEEEYMDEIDMDDAFDDEEESEE
ncbi:MAG: DUF1292 domain-containing protein [Clostridia bacterium]|jgi:putative Holliday junction resolvase|nr:DUF1292 domain-containing protein [Clostridia bacterium]MBO7400080.1 DUF1292 domain-containing protein [Clostridia bacterium]MBO7548699.1 DUF1292 domain-containing protein [Clostridia bacterium]MBP5238093.1 DUF1292 domain-containing protein [Clostridia bacterium]MBP5658245.1 DUF1292 domain-containing protein [Clostridia bacterium]